MKWRQWTRDVGLGVRFAFTGGREGWVRVTLTAVGVGLGVALLLLTTAVPNVLAVRHAREEARLDFTYGREVPRRSGATLVIADVDTEYRGKDVRGRLVEPEGPRAPVPPGVRSYPAVGSMLVSPALRSLLASDQGRLLRDRLPYRIAGTIGESGLIGSHELAYYAGAEGLAAKMDGYRVARITSFGRPGPATTERTDPVLLLLVLVVFVVLLMPVAVFIAAAVRFGGERRDRRLAALRLVGSDSRMTRRTAAGEALAGALLGLVLGAGFFLAGRQGAGTLEVLDISVFPDYLDPSPWLAVLVAVAVPAAAVLVTLFALRGVVIEPLGVVRTARPSRRRVWWRLLLPLAGLGMLAPMIGKGRDSGEFNQYLVTGGVVLVLVGITALLPWLVEAIVARLGAGPLSWQLAVRRLQLSSGTAARMVNGIAVAVAGAIALQMLFAGVESDYTVHKDIDVSRVQMQVEMPSGTEPAAAQRKLDRTPGVRESVFVSRGFLADSSWQKEPSLTTELTVGDCATLRAAARLSSCKDGDAFVVKNPDDVDTPKLAEPGRRLYVSPGGAVRVADDAVWRVPEHLTPVSTLKDPTGIDHGGFLLTRGALSARAAHILSGTAYLSVDDSVPDVREHIRNTAAAIDPRSDAYLPSTTQENHRFTSIRTGLYVGAICVLGLIGVSLLVSQLEQLRERRKLLSSLVAFGTRRRTLSLSVLWQTAVPIAMGLLLASAVGMVLGAVLLRMTATTIRVDWASVLSMTGAGALVVLAVSLLSLPPLLRLMRPEGLRTE